MITFFLLFVRLIQLMIFQSAYYTDKSVQLHERERSIKAARGRILDRNGVVLADNKTVCTISVIHSQIEDEEAVISFLCEKLELSEEYVRKRVEKILIHGEDTQQCVQRTRRRDPGGGSGGGEGG